MFLPADVYLDPNALAPRVSWHVAATLELNMQLFDFLMLALEQPYAQSLFVTLACALPTTFGLVFLARLPGANRLERRHEKPRRGLDDRLLRDLRTACRDFDREVGAWELAAQQQGGRL